MSNSSGTVAQFGANGFVDKKSAHAYSSYPRATRDRPWVSVPEQGEGGEVFGNLYRHRKTAKYARLVNGHFRLCRRNEV